MITKNWHLVDLESLPGGSLPGFNFIFPHMEHFDGFQNSQKITWCVMNNDYLAGLKMLHYELLANTLRIGYLTI